MGVAVNAPLRNVHTESGGATVDRGWHFDLPACSSGACNQGRAACPCPDACVLPVTMDDDKPSLFASRVFWAGGVLCLLAWTALVWMVLR
jgi:hypothetical protein